MAGAASRFVGATGLSRSSARSCARFRTWNGPIGRLCADVGMHRGPGRRFETSRLAPDSADGLEDRVREPGVEPGVVRVARE